MHSVAKPKWLPLACVGVLVLLAINFDVQKFFVLLYLRLTAPPAAKSVAEPAPTHPFLIAFDDAQSHENLFYSDTVDAVWQRLDQHQLVIRLGHGGPTLDVTSFGTTIGYKGKRMYNVYFYPFEGRLAYRAAVSRMQALLRRWGIDDKVTWAEYEARLNAPPADDEVFVPDIQLSSARIALFLYCDWDSSVSAKAQLDRVTCHPNISIDVKQAPSTSDAH